MIAKVAVEIGLAAFIFLVGGLFWQFFKRTKFLRVAICSEPFLQEFVTRRALDSPSPMNNHFARRLSKDANGYALNIKIVLDADRISQRRFQSFVGVAVLAALIGSYFLGPGYFAINFGIFLLTALVPISQSTQMSALDQVLALALILHRWDLEDGDECARWIEQAWSLRPLYNSVKQAS